MKPTLLVTDCDPLMCDIYQQFLAQFGYAVETASDGLECLRKIDQLRPVVVVLDQALPWGGGDGVLACLREDRVDHGLAVIVTATNPADRTENRLKLPVIHFLPKPFTQMDLLEAICITISKTTCRKPSKHSFLAHFSDFHNRK